MELNTGKELQNGKYRILGILGQGGFGITYLAEQTALGRKVAIKEFFMKDLCNRDDDGSHVSVPSVGSKELVERFRQKFLKEARSIASLEHKHIVPVIDVFEENGTAYYVMKYFGGGSLSACTALSEEKALRYIRQIASAIGFIHGRHMMHLDIKPGNILLDSEDNAIVIDFGLAKQYDEAGHQTSTTPVGISHGYAPLEQYKAGGVSSFSPATDIYSLGATLYRLLTDNRPADAMDLVSAPFPACPANVSASTWNAVKSAMQPAISSRPQSVKEFIALLENQDVIVGSEETEVAIDKTGTGQNTANGNAAVEENEIEVEVVETPSVAPEPAPRPQPEENQKKSKWLWIIILLAIICGTVGGFMLFGSGGDVKRDSVKDTAQQIAQKADTPTIQTDKKDTIAPLQQTVSEEPAAEQTTQLKIKGAPNGAYVYVDGKYFDKTPLKDATISIGEHAIKVVKEGYETYEKTHIFNSQSAAIDVNIKKSTVLLNLSTNPTGASVYVDGSYIGTSYISGYKVEQGTHKIMVKKTGYETFEHTYTFTSQAATINLTLTAKPKPQPQNKNTINGHEYVDLGLPSGLKWATCNVGASKPEEYGNHYAWGETSTKEDYSWSTYKWCNGSYDKITKYCSNSSYGRVDNKRKLELSDDVARKQWGSTWRLPTKAEFEELLSNCTWTWTTQNGIKGCKVTSKKNGNSIFFPAAGWRNGSSLNNQGAFGYYWSSTPRESYSDNACYLYFSSGNHSTNWYTRYNGRSVRPVTK